MAIFTTRIAWLCAVLVALPVAGVGQSKPGGEHDKAYWQVIVANNFEPPPGTSIESLLPELNGYFASPDSEFRDGVAYAVLVQWIYVKQLIPADDLRRLVAEWQENLKRGIGERDTDSVLLRSFSALMLSVAVACDNEKSPYLSDTEFDRLLQAALLYLHDERDVRGYDAHKGWLHSVAHTADLLKFLGRSRHLETQQQAAILAAIGDKLNSIEQPLIQGEDERLARAVVSIVARPDVDIAPFETFLNGLKPPPLPDPPTLAALAIHQNHQHFAMALHAVLATDPRGLESVSQADAMVQKLLETML